MVSNFRGCKRQKKRLKLKLTYVIRIKNIFNNP